MGFAEMGGEETPLSCFPYEIRGEEGGSHPGGVHKTGEREDFPASKPRPPACGGGETAR